MEFQQHLASMIRAQPLGRNIRLFSTSSRTKFLGNLFGSREAKNKEIIEKQDEYEVDPNSKIVILDKKNSPSYKPFSRERHMPGFKIAQWKDTQVRAKDIESTVTNEMVSRAINQAYQNVFGSEITPESYSSASLDNLELRFQFTKDLQRTLGFDIKDYIISRSHNVEYLYSALKKEIAHRWSSERNPNAIVLRPEDFSGQGNVYLNNERNAGEQKKYFRELKKKAVADQ